MWHSIADGRNHETISRNAVERGQSGKKEITFPSVHAPSNDLFVPGLVTGTNTQKLISYQFVCL
jgi:hypothetical protein